MCLHTGVWTEDVVRYLRRVTGVSVHLSHGYRGHGTVVVVLILLNSYLVFSNKVLFLDTKWRIGMFYFNCQYNLPLNIVCQQNIANLKLTNSLFIVPISNLKLYTSVLIYFESNTLHIFGTETNII